MEPYHVSVVPENLKRMHANESPKPILDYDILMKNVDENLNFYPENKAIKLVELASKFYNIDKAKIIATNGSDEGIDLCIRTFCNPAEDTILVAKPTFSMYEQYAQAFGVKIDRNAVANKTNEYIQQISNDITADISPVKNKLTERFKDLTGKLKLSIAGLDGSGTFMKADIDSTVDIFI